MIRKKKKITIKNITYFSLCIYIIAMSAFQLDNFLEKTIVISSFVVFFLSSIIMNKKIKITEELIWIFIFWMYYYFSLLWCNNKNDLLLLVKPSIQVIGLSICFYNFNINFNKNTCIYARSC